MLHRAFKYYNTKLKNATIFCLKVWITSIVLSIVATIISIMDLIPMFGLPEIGTSLLLFITIVLFSSPLFILFTIIVSFINHRDLSLVKKKIFIGFVLYVFTVISFLYSGAKLSMAIPYSLITLISILLYKLRPENTD